MYDILRCQPAILKVAQDALSQTLDTRAFPFLGDELEKQKSSRGPNWYKDRGEAEESRLILSVIGGLSHYEICCLQNLERAKGSQRVVLGATQLLTASDFIENLVPQKLAKLKTQKRAILIEEEDLEEEEKVPAQKPKKKSKRSEDEEQDAIEMEDIEVVQKKPTKKKSQRPPIEEDEEDNQSSRPKRPKKKPLPGEDEEEADVES